MLPQGAPCQLFCVDRSKLLPMLRDTGLTTTVSRREQISNDCTMVRVVSDTLLRRLQSVLNAAAWLVFSARKSEHITPLLCELHWLRVPERIKFRLCVLAFRCLHGTAPPYLAETLHLTTSRNSCSRLRSAATSTLIVPAAMSYAMTDPG